MSLGIEHGPEPWLRYSPPFFGVALGASIPEKREAVRANLRRILGRRSPSQEAADIARVFGAYASCLTEAMLLGSKRGFALRPRQRGVEHYVAARARGRGVLIATAHTGGWEALGAVMRGVHAGEVVVVMQRERDEGARAIQDRARLNAGVTVHHVGTGPLDALPLLAYLRRGAVVAMQIDRSPPGLRVLDSTLFGTPFSLPEGPLVLSALSGAPILPVFTRRIGFMEYEARVFPPIDVPRRPTQEQRLAAAATLVSSMEEFLRENPTQWFHFVP